jgi:glycosyltransferase involved in cell wall biosynthesis
MEGRDGFVQGLSVVMIMKNAGRYLSLVLRSLTKVADEVIVVDTGSSDSSREIARRYGCRIFDFAWCDDFSKAKNHGIEQARFSWILSVDADEVLYDPRACGILEAALSDPDVPAYVIWVDNLYDTGRVDQVRMLRLFRNTPRLRFSNPVHESIGEALYAGWPGFVPPVLDIHLRHYGYLSANAQGKHERNIVLLQKWADAAPDNIYANYKLGGTLVEAGRGQEALPYLERTFGLFAGCAERSSYPFLGTFITFYRDLLVAEGLTDEAERCNRAVAGWV